MPPSPPPTGLPPAPSPPPNPARAANPAPAPTSGSGGDSSGRIGNGRGSGEMVLIGSYRELIDGITPDTSPEDKAAILVEAQRSAARQAGASPAGYRTVLADAKYLLHRGHPEWAAMLAAAAELGKSNPPQPVKHRPPKESRPPADTFPQRMEEVRTAAQLVRQWEEYYQNLHIQAGGTYDKGTCNPCRHAPHPDVTCHCGCGTYREPTPGQIAAFEAWTSLHHAKQEWDKRIAAARKATPGDWFKVVRGRNVPHGTRGRIVRTHPGNYGEERALLELDDGNTVWVTVKHLTRDSPGFAPGVGDPLPPQ